MGANVFLDWLARLNPNTVTAWPAFVMALLAAYSFGPRFYRGLAGPARAMASGICVFAAFAAFRLFFWDVFQHVAPEALQFSTRAGDVSRWINAACNIGWIVAFYLMLGAIHQQIPPADRARGVWRFVIFAPFYPGHFRLVAAIFGRRGRR